MHAEDSVPTAAAERARATTLGLEGEAVDLFVRATAPQRHEHRVRRAADALLRACIVRGEDQPVDDAPTYALSASYPHQVGARVAAMLDEVGVGGPLGMGDASATGRGEAATTRLPGLAGLGKGRKAASDGGAWTSAIAQAASQIGARFLLVRPPAADGSEGDVCGLMAALDTQPRTPIGGDCVENEVPQEDRDIVWVSVTPVGGYDWIHALARRVVVDVARGTTTVPALPVGRIDQWGRLMADTAPKPIATAPVYTAIDEDDVEVIRRYPTTDLVVEPVRDYHADDSDGAR